MSRYALTEYTTASGPMCSHPELIPGLDAFLCPRCQLVWNLPRNLPAQSATKLETQTLPIMQAAPKPNQKLPATPTFEYAITLHRPWPYAIAQLGKDIENRTWRCRLKPGEWLAIHAGRGYDFAGEDWILERFPECKLPEAADHPTGIVAIAQFKGNITESKSIWFGGPIGWQLGNVMPLTKPVACPGKQGLWKPSQEVKQAVYRALEANT